MSTYQRADREAKDLLMNVMDLHHTELSEAGLKIDLLWAFGPVDKDGQKIGPAIKHQGYEAAGVAKITTLKDRAKGLGDAEIVVDGDRWPHWGEAKRRALLDHELQHLELVNIDGEDATDDLGRPLLKTRRHDHQFGWFDAVARRNGEASLEVEQARALMSSADAQMWLPFMGQTPKGADPQTPAAEVLQLARSGRSLKARAKADRAVEDAVKDFRDTARKAGLHVSTSVNDGPPVTVFDPATDTGH